MLPGLQEAVKGCFQERAFGIEVDTEGMWQETNTTATTSTNKSQ